MLYELAMVAKPDASEADQTALFSLVKDTLKDFEGEVALEDNWGLRTFAQPTADGVEKGVYLYVVFKANVEANKELNRRFKINEKIQKFLIVKLGEDSDVEAYLKRYKCPFSKTNPGSVTDSEEEGADSKKDRRKFARRKSCWFTAKGISSDWKDPNTYSWLVNEFGKIAPSRISGVSRKHQRVVTSTVKRARQIGIISHLSNQTLA